MKQIFIDGLNHNYIRPPANDFRRLNWIKESRFPAVMQKTDLLANRVGSLLHPI
jgi:hypothetical protein